MASTFVALAIGASAFLDTPSTAQTATPARKSPVSESRRPFSNSRPARFSATKSASLTERDASSARTTSTGWWDEMLYVVVTFTVVLTYSVTFTVVLNVIL